MLDKLKENPKNPRTLNKAAFEKLKNKGGNLWSKNMLGVG